MSLSAVFPGCTPHSNFSKCKGGKKKLGITQSLHFEASVVASLLGFHMFHRHTFVLLSFLLVEETDPRTVLVDLN